MALFLSQDMDSLAGRALIFANGDANDGPVVQQALQIGSDAIVIAADGGARIADNYQCVINTIVGDMDSLSPSEIEVYAQRGVEIRRYAAEKDETDLELALLLAVERGARWIRIIGGVGDRLDQTLANVYLMALPILTGCDVRLVASKQESWLLGAGEHVIFGAQGDTVSLIPLSGAVVGVQTQNLYYPLRDETLNFGPARGVSNVMTGSQAIVGIREGVLLIIHTLGRA